MDEHNRIELDTVQKVILISCGVSEVFMAVYLAGACGISMWRLSYPERGATEWSGASHDRSLLRVAGGSSRLIFRGSKVEIRRMMALRQEIGRWVVMAKTATPNLCFSTYY
jgi:hypothetical protein